MTDFRRLLVALTLGVLIAAPVLAQEKTKPPDAAPTRSEHDNDRAAFGVAQSQFGVALMRQLIAQHRGGAVALSPIGVTAVLAMGGLGATDPARQAIAATLRLPPAEADGFAIATKAIAAARDQHADVVLDLANALFVSQQTDIATAFQQRLQAAFGIAGQKVDFTKPLAAQTIDAWVSGATGGQIKHLVADLPADTQSVLASALYFRGKWSIPFPKRATTPTVFHGAGGKTSKVAMMLLTDGLLFRGNADLEAVDLGYGSGDVRLTVLLPRSAVTPITKIIDIVAKDPSWLAGEGFRTSSGTLRLPRFVAGLRTELLPTLSALGLKPALVSDAFSMMGTPAPLLTSIVQETRIEVDEEGSEAAAATGAVMGRAAAVPFTMTCDHPFLFSLHQRSTGVLLLVGVTLTL